MVISFVHEHELSVHYDKEVFWVSFQFKDGKNESLKKCYFLRCQWDKK